MPVLLGEARIERPWVVTTIRIPYADTDMMEHVYYGNYLTYFEIGRNEWMRAAGLAYREFEAMGYVVPVAEAHVKYKGRIFYDDLIEIYASASIVGNTRIRFDYELRRAGSPKVLSEGQSFHAVMTKDGTTYKLCRVPQVLIDLTKDVAGVRQE